MKKISIIILTLLIFSLKGYSTEQAEWILIDSTLYLSKVSHVIMVK